MVLNESFSSERLPPSPADDGRSSSKPEDGYDVKPPTIVDTIRSSSPGIDQPAVVSPHRKQNNNTVKPTTRSPHQKQQPHKKRPAANGTKNGRIKTAATATNFKNGGRANRPLQHQQSIRPQAPNPEVRRTKKTNNPPQMKNSNKPGSNIPEESVQKKHLSPSEKQAVIRKAERYLRANIKLISACQDEQITMDCSNVSVRFGLRQSKRASVVVSKDGGACTTVLLKILYKYHAMRKDGTLSEDPSYMRLLGDMRDMLKLKGYQQVPAVTSSRFLTLKDKFRVIPPNFGGNRKALIIGINYTGKAFELPGCHNDCYNLIKFLKDVHGFVDEDFTILMDDDGKHAEPTRENILKALHRFAFSVNPGDAVFFHYAGHGSTQPDDNGDEESGMDSTMLPVDYQMQGVIVDDEIFRLLLVPMPSGVEMTAVMDCCHSGSIFDLPFEYIISQSGKQERQTEEEALADVRFPHMGLVLAEQRRIEEVMDAQQKRASQIEKEFLRPPPKRNKRKQQRPLQRNRARSLSPKRTSGDKRGRPTKPIKRRNRSLSPKHNRRNNTDKSPVPRVKGNTSPTPTKSQQTAPGKNPNESIPKQRPAKNVNAKPLTPKAAADTAAETAATGSCGVKKQGQKQQSSHDSKIGCCCIL